MGQVGEVYIWFGFKRVGGIGRFLGIDKDLGIARVGDVSGFDAPEIPRRHEVVDPGKPRVFFRGREDVASYVSATRRGN